MPLFRPRVNYCASEIKSLPEEREKSSVENHRGDGSEKRAEAAAAREWHAGADGDRRLSAPRPSRHSTRPSVRLSPSVLTVRPEAGGAGTVAAGRREARQPLGQSCRAGGGQRARGEGRARGGGLAARPTPVPLTL